MLKTISTFSAVILNSAILIKDSLDTAAAAVTGQIGETVFAILQAFGGLL